MALTLSPGKMNSEPPHNHGIRGTCSYSGLKGTFHFCWSLFHTLHRLAVLSSAAATTATTFLRSAWPRKIVAHPPISISQSTREDDGRGDERGESGSEGGRKREGSGATIRASCKGGRRRNENAAVEVERSASAFTVAAAQEMISHTSRHPLALLFGGHE